MIKRIFTLLICVLLLVSCSSVSNVSSLPNFINDSFSVSYNGMDVVMYTEEGSNGPMLLEYEDNQSIQADAVRNRLSYIEKILDVNLELSTKGAADFDEYYITAIGSGLKPVDIFYRGGDNSLWDLADAGVLIPITNFPDYIDLNDEDKYGTPGVLEAAMINGVPYAVQPTYWPGLQGVECFFLTYNADKFQSLGLTPLHEYFENETWTWDTFKSFCDLAIPLLSSENSEYVFSARDMYLLNMMFYANGFDYVDIVNGEPRLNLYADSAVHAIEFFQELLRYGNMVEHCSDHHDYSSFIEERSLTKLAMAKALTVGNIAYNANFTYNIMPFPCGPDVEYGSWGQTVTRINGLAIPITVESPDISAHIISELCEPFEEFGGSREGILDYYKQNVFLSELDVEIFFDVEKYVRFDYDDPRLLFDYTDEIAINASKGSAVELIQKYASGAEDVYYTYIEPNLLGYMIEHMNIE